MKAKNKSRRLWLWIGVAVAAVAIIAAVLIMSLRNPDMQVENKIDATEAQTIVDETFGSLAKKTALGATSILDRTEVTVKSVEYGYDKDVILSCTYKSVDVSGALMDKLDDIMADVYGFYLANEAEGKKTNATKVNIEISKDIVEYLEKADEISGDITLRIYETDSGMVLHLTEADINTCTGGLIAVSDAISEIKEVTYEGEKVDISLQNTLRSGTKDCIAIENISFDKPVTGGPVKQFVEDFKTDFHNNFIAHNRWMSLLKGLGVTLSITALAVCLGILLGFVVAIVRCTNQMTGKLTIIDKICRFYLTITRGTPVVVQLLIIYFVVFPPLERMLGVSIDNFTSAVICFGVNSGAYVAEIVRGGIMAIDKGQIEAGRSLGFNYVQTMVNFVIPQAFKAILPSLANEFITLLKESSIAFYIGVADVTAAGNAIRASTFSAFMPLIAVAVIYLVLVLILTKLVSILERRLAKSDH